MRDAPSAELRPRHAGQPDLTLPATVCGATADVADSPTALPARRRASRAPDLPPLAQTTPTFLPELLRAVSDEARRLANDRTHALDNNPFIMREWLSVSQVLHAAAYNMENRF